MPSCPLHYGRNCSSAVHDAVSPFDFRRAAPTLRTNGLPFVLSVARRAKSKHKSVLSPAEGWSGVEARLPAHVQRRELQSEPLPEKTLPSPAMRLPRLASPRPAQNGSLPFSLPAGRYSPDQTVHNRRISPGANPRVRPADRQSPASAGVGGHPPARRPSPQ